MTTTLTPGTIKRFDFQSDQWRTEYRLVEDLGSGRWLCEKLAPRPEVLDEMLDLAVAEEAGGYQGVFGVDKIAGVEEEFARLVEETGERFEIRFVSSARWAEMF